MRRPSLQALPDLSALLPPGYVLREQRPDEDMAGLAALLQAASPEHAWTPEKAHDALGSSHSRRRPTSPGRRSCATAA